MATGARGHGPGRSGIGMSDKTIVSRQRVADHGEVFTPSWLVEAMLDLVKAETERIDSRFLEPACGNGNFLVPILRRKLDAVDRTYLRLDFDRRCYALLAMMCIYGIELLEDNVRECRANLLAAFSEHLDLCEEDDLYWAASYVLSQNIVHGDALSMRNAAGEPIIFAEWGYAGRGRYQRRDFLYQDLATASSFGQQGIFDSSPENHPSLVPTQTMYRRRTIRDLAALVRAKESEG